MLPSSGAHDMQASDESDQATANSVPVAMPLWLWPALATIAVAATGQLAGVWWAAIMIVLITTASMPTIIGARTGRHRSWAAVVAVVVAVIAVGALFLYRDALQTLTSSPSHSPAAPTTTGTPTPLLVPGADLRGLDLSKRSLARVNLRGADLSGADLSRTDLSGAILDGAILLGADFHDACLRSARLNGAALSGADFTGADVRDAVIDASADALPTTWPPVPSVLVTCRS